MMHIASVIVSLAPMHTVPFPPPPSPWGAYGHTLAARAAVRTLPDAVPAFFREAEEELAYLNPEPDRWRDRAEARLDAAMNGAFAPDHWIHLDEVPESAFAAENRFDFILALDRAGLNAEEVGTLPYRILELAQRVRSGFRMWRHEADPTVRRWIEQRIVNDAGILGHYVTDGSNPHHTTMHFDGWVGENPNGFPTERGFHGRFESEFVDARVSLEDLLATANRKPTVLASFRAGTLEHLHAAHAALERLYELERVRRFDSTNSSAEHKAFAVQRLSAGATMLRDIWWTAWITSGDEGLPGS